MSAISKGMVVQLISGGPKMAVVSVGSHASNGGPEEGAVCVWFDGKQEKCEEVFDVAVLKQYVAPTIRM